MYQFCNVKYSCYNMQNLKKNVLITSKTWKLPGLYPLNPHQGFALDPLRASIRPQTTGLLPPFNKSWIRHRVHESIGKYASSTGTFGSSIFFFSDWELYRPTARYICMNYFPLPPIEFRYVL